MLIMWRFPKTGVPLNHPFQWYFIMEPQYCIMFPAFGGFLSHRGTPSHHPRSWDPWNKPTNFEIPEFMETPICGVAGAFTADRDLRNLDYESPNAENRSVSFWSFLGNQKFGMVYQKRFALYHLEMNIDGYVYIYIIIYIYMNIIPSISTMGKKHHWGWQLLLVVFAGGSHIEKTYERSNIWVADKIIC